MHYNATEVSQADPVVDARAARLLQSLDAQAARAGEGRSAWLPISTAPRDGTTVLLWAKWQNSPAGPVIARWDARQKQWARHGSTRALASDIVTHWTMLPASPA